MAARLRAKYNDEVVPKLITEFNIKNVMSVPKLAKIVVNMGVHGAQLEARLLENAVKELTLITGQKASIRKARKSIAGFKLREGQNIACMTTLRGDRMYEFLDRLVSIAIPRVRDFRGVSPKGFDKAGNYTLGIRDQTIFPEVNLDQVDGIRGMNITFVIDNAGSADKGRELLRLLGMPFRN